MPNAHNTTPAPVRALDRLRCLLALSSALGACPVLADSAEFDSSFLQPFAGTGAGPNLDLDAITRSSVIGPGTYPVTLRLNQSFFDRRQVTFAKPEGRDEVRPCLTAALLDELGVKGYDRGAGTLAPTGCVELEAAVPGASVSFDGNQLTLDLLVPQIALRRDAIGYVAEQQWDSGINAGLLNYQFNATQAHSDQQGQSAQYSLYTRSGLNVAGWRLRANSVLSQDGQATRRWQRTSTYAQRDLPGRLGTLTLGESFTPGDVFDSLPLRGVQVASDMGMLPDSLQGYAPIIRGVAQTYARVDVKQNGYALYSTYVPPGPFEISDLTAAAGSGELEVLITEADGREQRFTQPYATLGNLLRRGIWRYSAAYGRYNSSDENQPPFGQASLAYGLPMDFTLYGGVLGADFHQQGQLGLGKNLGSLGALSVDVSHAVTDNPHGPTDHGQSYRWRFGKAFASGTSVRFAGYRYSTRGYRDFPEAVAQQHPLAGGRYTKRSKLEASVAQPLAKGSMYLNLSQQDYWGTRRQDQQLQLGYNGYWRGLNFGVYASKALDDNHGQDKMLAVTLSVPLGNGSNASYGVTRNADASLDQRAGLNGRVAGQEHLGYNLDLSHSSRGTHAATGSLNYLAPYAQMGASLSHGSGYRQATVSASGSLLAHADGLVLGQTSGETMALVHVPDTPDVGVMNAPASLTDAKGYLLVPFLTPYRKNRLALDSGLVDTQVDIDNGVGYAVPRRGAVVKAVFQASRSDKVVAVLKLANGATPPFGSKVMVGAQTVAVVGPGGQVLLSIKPDNQVFIARWGQGNTQQCHFSIPWPQPPAQGHYPTIGAMCTSLAPQEPQP
ncbi:fimbria/pilus outer membrane usher protein [Pseudomonas sp. TE3610]